jgi:hypothetical protein
MKTMKEKIIFSVIAMAILVVNLNKKLAICPNKSG